MPGLFILERNSWRRQSGWNFNMEDFLKRDLLETLFSNATEGMVITDRTGKIRLANPSAGRMLGYSVEELMERGIEDLVPDNVRSRHEGHRLDYDRQAQSRPMGVGKDLYAKRKDGSLLPVEISLSPLDIRDTRFYIAFIIDITIRKEIEYAMIDKQKELERVAAALISTNEELEKKVSGRTKVLQEAIRELEKSRAYLSQALEKEKDLNDLKSRFISMASHEFRTPLTTILSSVSLISEYNQGGQADLTEKRTRHIQRIRSAVNNLNDILSDFLSISKLEEGKVVAEYRTFDLHELAREIIHDMQVNLKSGQELNYHHSGPAEVNLDRKLMKNIMINLISNAIKFTPEKKIIHVKTNVDAYTAMLEVRDEGIGISEDDQKHLFERFYRGKNAFNIQGTGLGLHIVGNYVDLMKGHINLQSELEKGTTIKISFQNTTN